MQRGQGAGSADCAAQECGVWRPTTSILINEKEARTRTLGHARDSEILQFAVAQQGKSVRAVAFPCYYLWQSTGGPDASCQSGTCKFESVAYSLRLAVEEGDGRPWE